MENNDIKKALECCTVGIGTECEKCPYMRTAYCNDVLKKEVLALINSQEQRIKELTEENERLRAENIARLPIKVGQIVYVPWRYAFQRAVATVRIEEIKFYDSQMHYMFLIDMESDNECFNQSFGGWKIEQSIGKTVFLTKEEAEKALKGE